MHGDNYNIAALPKLSYISCNGNWIGKSNARIDVSPIPILLIVRIGEKTETDAISLKNDTAVSGSLGFTTADWNDTVRGQPS